MFIFYYFIALQMIVFQEKYFKNKMKIGWFNIMRPIIVAIYKIKTSGCENKSKCS